MESSRKRRLRQWMFERNITFQAVAERTGMSFQTANRLLNADEIPSRRHEQFLRLGFPAELLPMPLDKKPGPKVADPETLCIFGTLKARAFNFLDRHAVRFMCGWAVPGEKAGMVIDELGKIRDEFFRAQETFLADYDQHPENWIAKHSDWADIIRNSIVGSDYVRAHMDFRWQMYKVAPLIEYENEKAVLEAGLAEEVTGLGATLFSEVSKSADEIWKKVYAGKNEVTHKALSPLRECRHLILAQIAMQRI